MSKKNKKIIMMGDFHGMPQDEEMKKLVNQYNSVEPVIIKGDYIDTESVYDNKGNLKKEIKTMLKYIPAIKITSLSDLANLDRAMLNHQDLILRYKKNE